MNNNRIILQKSVSSYIIKNYDVGVKRYFDPFDTRLLRALHSRNPQKHS